MVSVVRYDENLVNLNINVFLIYIWFFKVDFLVLNVEQINKVGVVKKWNGSV